MRGAGRVFCRGPAALLLLSLLVGTALAQPARQGWGPFFIGMSVEEARIAGPQLNALVSESGSGMLFGDSGFRSAEHDFSIRIHFYGRGAGEIVLEADLGNVERAACEALYPHLLRASLLELGPLDDTVGPSAFLAPRTTEQEVEIEPEVISADGDFYYRFDVAVYDKVVLLRRSDGARSQVLLISERDAHGGARCSARIEIRR
jgi:hypothetical protein